jgi:hypothetical protein
VRINLEIGSVPVALHLEATAVLGDRNIRLGRITAPTSHAPSFRMTMPLAAEIRDLDSNTIDIILRPDIQAAERSGATSTWGGEIIFRDVRLSPPDESASPSGER